jgi:hypothetical protein
VYILAMHASLMRCGVILGEVICQIFACWFSINSALSLYNPVFNPIKYDVEFSILIGVGGCGCPISSSITRSGAAYLALLKIDPTSAVDDITCFMMLERHMMEALMSCCSPSFCPR